MKQILNSYTYPDWPNIEIDYDKPVRLFIDSFQGYNPNENSFNILYIKEAEAISNIRSEVIKNQDKFDAIITFDEEILKNCKNSHFLLFGTTWVHDYKFSEKKFQISNITGHKEFTDGHALRKKIHYKQAKIKNPIDFFISKYGGVENFNNNKVLGDTKVPLFESQFHICIENSKQKNYFTEKIIDCFVTKTVPIYWGCPNIGDFFDTSAIIIVNDFNEIITTCNDLDEQSYNKLLPGIEKNAILSKNYIDLVENVKNLLQKILKKSDI